MKKWYLFSLIFCLSLGVKAQIINGFDLTKVSDKQRQSLLQNLSPDERKELLRKYRDAMFIEELKIEDDTKKEEFKKLYDQYQEEQRKIKEGNYGQSDIEKLTDEEARKRLEQSFETGERLMNNRRRYAIEMQKIIKPQQVLKMFMTEGAMREKIMHKRNEIKDSTARMNNSMQQGFRQESSPSTPSMSTPARVPSGNAEVRQNSTPQVRSNTRP